MLKKIVILLVLLSAFMAACSSSTTGLPTETPVETESPRTEISPSPEASPTQDAGQATELAEAYCTVVSRQPTPGPTEQSLVPLVGDEDWTQGPDDAQVTFIEYGDFQ